MGCFLACFGGAKDRKQRRRNKKSLPTNNPVNRNYKPLQISSSLHKSVIQQESDEAEIFQSSQTNLSPQKPIIKEAAAADVSELSALVPELREKEEQPNSISCRKKVTFDLNVKTYQNAAFDEAINDPLEDEEGKGEVKDRSKGKVSPDPNYRYQNCDTSDDEGIEDDDEEFDDSDFDDEDEDDEVAVVGAGEESYDPFFSLPMDKEKQQHDSEEVNSPVPTSSVSANRGARDRSQYVHSVLNPVENLLQWKEVKVRALPLKNPNKENNNAELESMMKGSNNENSGLKLETKLTGLSPEPTFKTNRPQKPSDLTSTPNYSTKQEISVDASLSTWLVSSENSPKGSTSHWSNSTVSREEQPILGALTVEDLKQSSSVTSSPRRSPSRNPDEIPILGTVGSYWNSRTEHSDIKGIPNTTSKYREDKRVNWHSTPFKVRLERALNEGAAEAFMKNMEGSAPPTITPQTMKENIFTSFSFSQSVVTCELLPPQFSSLVHSRKKGNRSSSTSPSSPPVQCYYRKLLKLIQQSSGANKTFLSP